jgi:hypothetical protein
VEQWRLLLSEMLSVVCLLLAVGCCAHCCLGPGGVTTGAAAAYCGVVVAVSLPEKGLRRIILAPAAMQEGRCVAGSQAGRQAGGPGEGLTVSLTQQPLPALLHLARSLLRSVHLSLRPSI